MTQPRFISSALVALALVPCACIISGSDGDDDGNASNAMGDDSGGTSGGDGPTTQGGPSTTANDTANDSANDTANDGTGGADVIPQAGAWLYQETGGTTNDCTFLPEVSNGFGHYQLTLGGAGEFTITPNDGTDPFACTYGGGDYDCPERAQGTYDIGGGVGADAIGTIYVGISGNLLSATEMDGTQLGHIDCAGVDCAQAATVLGVSFPCAFEVPFTGTAS